MGPVTNLIHPGNGGVLTDRCDWARSGPSWLTAPIMYKAAAAAVAVCTAMLCVRRQRAMMYETSEDKKALLAPVN
ncbi:Uncharacterized protein HZ326_26503 [Fusarium oxysporum f. sp. albedinis]|nr:Uncharacterized protein HZ326_26503 [Fusarium oxysporum f. sp. albedinis]